MGKRLYYSSSSLAAPHIGVIIDDILAARKVGDEIYWAYCHCGLTSCFMNLDGYNSICSMCHCMYNEYKRVYGKGVHMLPLKKSMNKSKDNHYDFHNAVELKSFRYRNVEVGISILSMYYTATRDLDLNNFDAFHEYARPLVKEICDLIDIAYQLVEEIKPDIIIVHNGRLFENRFFYDIAKAMSISFKAVETVGGYGEPYAKMSYLGELPHNIQMWNRMIKTIWEQSPESDEEKTKIASSFYEGRRKGQLMVDVKVYTADQVKGLLPEGFDFQKRNVAICTSSQDELAALGRDASADLLFPNQSEAVKYIFQNSPTDIHYYLRIHPNLKGVNFKDHLDLYQYDKYPNVTVLAPESKVSTYALVDACEKVISFGSSVGIEASFWGKPSILIGHAYYEGVDACYVIKKKEDIIPTIVAQLTPKPKLGSLKCAYFLLDRKYKVDKTLIDINVKRSHHHWDFTDTTYFKIWNSRTIYQLSYFWHFIVMPKFIRPLHKFPWVNL